ncbi:uncharacterized protein AMSG_06623 [Thecamonas trahens ATCC 50062]|uniref:RRM domain-containing protein n=1 Tax=Thecamonas trahens ATCC 50062 TaxID=461836 RepID=A0A0L0DET7_THETB|nr:hypothetical protein AMSG_06623 [Thecamonas trahens ATCC 50062]KNC50735.1 hypothetical protein AMSG_06623 [Thecamonas trahens ATCC 50062]|eukprot:XP_013756701.1 hypothetical protein AMSG_06623 [Thecamonas trahens ATCC 50062]
MSMYTWGGITLEESALARTALVTNISAKATEANIKTFFTYCGTIEAFAMSPATDPPATASAAVVFEANSGFTTALLLSNASIVDSAISVTALTPTSPGVVLVSGAKDKDEAEAEAEAEAGASASASMASTSEPASATSAPAKTKSCILAEMIAAGYVVGSGAVARARAFDADHVRLGSALSTSLAAVSVSGNKVALAVDAGIGRVDTALGLTPAVNRAAASLDSAITSVSAAAMQYSAVQAAAAAFSLACAAADTAYGSVASSTASAVRRRQQTQSVPDPQPAS